MEFFDLVAQLRETTVTISDAMSQRARAADEIERLRAELAKLQGDFQREKREHELTWNRMAKRTEELAAAKTVIANIVQSEVEPLKAMLREGLNAEQGLGVNETLVARIRDALGEDNEPVQKEPAGE